MIYYAAGVLLAMILGLFLPYPMGLAVVAGVALGGMLRLGGRVDRLESIVRDRLGLEDPGPYWGGEGYVSERERVRALMQRYEREKKEGHG